MTVLMLSSPAMRGGALVVSLSSLLLAARGAHAQSVDRQACVAAYEGAQTATKHHHFARAKAQVAVCLNAACPSVLRSECAQWLTDLESRQPTVVLACQGPDGAAATHVEVRVDGEVLTGTLDGKAIDIDPGSHELTFTLPGEAPLALRVVVREGEKLQRVTGAFPLRPGAPAPPPVARGADRRPVPWTAYALGGLGVATTGAFVGLGLWGDAGKSDLEPCKPDCSSSATSEVRGRYIAADVMLGIAVVSFGAAAVLYFTRGTFRSPTAVSSLGFRL